MPCNKVVDGLTATAISNRLQLNSGDSGKPFADHVLSRADPASECVSKPGLSLRERYELGHRLDPDGRMRRKHDRLARDLNHRREILERVVLDFI